MDSSPHIVHRIFSRKVLIAIIVVTLVSIFSYLWFLYSAETVLRDVDFRVEQGDGIQTIAGKLTRQGIIKHPLFFYFSYYAFGRHTDIQPGGYQLSSSMKVRDVVHVLEAESWSKFVTIPAGVSKEEISTLVSNALNWDILDRQYFSHTYAGMQWQHYQEEIEGYFQTKFNWNDKKTLTFLTLSSLYYDINYDFMRNMYIPGTYEIPVHSSRAQVAGIILDQFTKDHPDNSLALAQYVDQSRALNVAKLIDEQMVLMPDIVAVPPQDITIKKSDGRIYLLFSTLYWNKGRGPLELVADPKTKGITGDVERDVYQRIYRLDGDYTERLSGKFLWHSPHLHYHFQDFALYELYPANSTDSTKIISQKSTFCIRDTEPVDLSQPGATKSASYTVCGKERQGISAGWADAYYYNYVDQKFDITDLDPGQYVLKITINPLDRFQEITKDNNVGLVRIALDPKAGQVRVLEEKTDGI